MKLTEIPIVLAVGLLAVRTTYEYREFGSKEPDKYYGTQPEHHELSEYFSVNVEHRLMKFYFLGRSAGDRELPGTVGTYWFGRSNYGPRGSAYAIADDGKRQLFLNEPGIAEGQPINSKIGTVAAELYVFDVESSRRPLLYPDVHRQGGSCVELPRS